MASALAVCLATATSLIEIKTHLGSTRERGELRGNPDGEPDELAEIYVRRGLDADLATIAISTFGASAAIVCQGNVCRHTHEAHDFPMKRVSSFMRTIGTGVRTRNSASANTRAAIGTAENGWGGRFW